MVSINSTFTGKIQNCSQHGPPKLQNAKKNTANGDLHHSKRISLNFDEEILLVKEKFMKFDYPLRFINSVFNEFQKGKNHGGESFIIPSNLF